MLFFRMKVPLQRPKFTRYFVFTRVNPRTSDYDHLLETCSRIDAWVVYKTVYDGFKIRMLGFLVLRGPRTVSNDIALLLPNFLVNEMPGHFNDGWDWLDAVSSKGDEVFFNGKTHPFTDIKKKLF